MRAMELPDAPQDITECSSELQRVWRECYQPYDWAAPLSELLNKYAQEQETLHKLEESAQMLLYGTILLIVAYALLQVVTSSPQLASVEEALLSPKSREVVHDLCIPVLTIVGSVTGLNLLYTHLLDQSLKIMQASLNEMLQQSAFIRLTAQPEYSLKNLIKVINGQPLTPASLNQNPAQLPPA